LKVKLVELSFTPQVKQVPYPEKIFRKTQRPSVDRDNKQIFIGDEILSVSRFGLNIKMNNSRIILIGGPGGKIQPLSQPV